MRDDDLSESNEDFDRISKQEQDEAIERALSGDGDVYLENYNGKLEINRPVQVKERPSVVMQAQPPVILNPAPVVTGKGYVLAIGLMFILTVGMQLLLAWRDSRKESEWAEERKESQRALKAISLDLERLRTPPVRATDSENGSAPISPPKRYP